MRVHAEYGRVMTQRRTVRIDDTLWHAAQQQAASEGRTVTDVIREALTRYVARNNADD